MVETELSRLCVSQMQVGPGVTPVLHAFPKCVVTSPTEQCFNQPRSEVVNHAHVFAGGSDDLMASVFPEKEQQNGSRWPENEFTFSGLEDKINELNEGYKV